MSDIDEMYVELGDEEAPPNANSEILEIIKNLEKEVVQLRTSNEHLLQANNEEERLVRELTSKSSHHDGEQERKREETKPNLERSKSGDISSKIDSKS